MVPEGPEVGVQEILVAHLHFLQAHHVGRAALQPMRDELHARPHAVDVPGCDTHGLPVSHFHFMRGAGMVYTATARSRMVRLMGRPLMRPLDSRH